MRNLCPAAVGICLVCGLVSLAGCGDGDQITSYPVPTASAGSTDDAPIPVAGAQGAQHTPANVTLNPARMLVAMVEDGKQTWFFKLLGPVDAVAKHEEEFQSFVGSLQFSEGTPQWTAPSGWSPQGKKGLRLETFHVGTHQPPLEMTVIPLGTMTGGGDGAILENLNRWRSQLRLKPITGETLTENIERVKLAKGAEAIVMDLTGEVPTSSREGHPPFAGGPMANRGNPGAATVPGRPAANTGAGSSPISYNTPEGWTEGEKSALRLAAFNVSDGEKTALITVFRFPPSGVLANVNRWRGQIGLAAMTQADLDKELKSITVDGNEGHLAELVGETQTILAVIVERAGSAWFFKLQGDVELAASEKGRFEAFVKSVKFK
ncbi:MAG: hypothetical protein HOL01_03320 [Planctomycetaceae bacterium]|nr:hypothetical protein [Planctomycetaceae bacterium]MBT6486750.1 hypothetical protein [Planctomycetaceae bacterium]MBT6493562.1 hypothetical protein [Planctomycetaceae bacterium]